MGAGEPPTSRWPVPRPSSVPPRSSGPSRALLSPLYLLSPYKSYHRCHCRRFSSPFPPPPSSPCRPNSSSLLHLSPLHLAISSAIISRVVCASQRSRYRSGSRVSRRLQPRVTAIRGELRHRGQLGTVRVNVFDLAFPHRGYLCLLMRLPYCPTHGETRPDVEVLTGAAVAIA
jgi:hypothetical protein